MINTCSQCLELKKQYDLAKPFANGNLAPRIGNYFIYAVTSQPIGIFKNVPMAEALWSINLDGLQQGLPVEIQLDSLMLPQAKGPNVKWINEFLDRTIKVNYGMTKEIRDENACYSLYVVNWQFI